MTNYRTSHPLVCFLCSPGGFLSSLWTHYRMEFFVSCHSLCLNTCIFLATEAFRISRLEYVTFFLTFFSTNNVSPSFNCRVWFLSLLNGIGRVNRMDRKRKVSEVYDNNIQGSRLRGRPKHRWRNCVQTGINKCKITNWKEIKQRVNWGKSFMEEKVRVGL